MYAQEFGATFGVDERVGDRHLARHRWVVGLELDRLDDLRVRHEFDEPAVERVTLRFCLTSSGGHVIVNVIRNMPPFRASKEWMWLVI